MMFKLESWDVISYPTMFEELQYTVIISVDINGLIVVSNVSGCFEVSVHQANYVSLC